MSSVAKVVSVFLFTLTMAFLCACEDKVATSAHSGAVLKKGNATIQMDAHFNEDGSVSVTVTSLLDLPFVDIKTKVLEEWRDLARVQDLRAGEPQTLVLANVGVEVEYIWATSDTGGPRWAAQTRVIASEPESLSQKVSVKLMSLSSEDSAAEKLRESFVGKKIME